MQVQELVTLGQFLKTFIKERNLAGVYQQLIDAVNQAAQNQNPENVQTHLVALRKLHEEVVQQVLSPAQAKLMEDYGAHELLGKAALEQLDQIFASHQAHPQGLVAALQKLLKRTNQLVSNATQLVTVLEPLLESIKDMEPELANDEGRLWLYFADAASINTINDLEVAAETWKQVLHHFSRLPGAATEGGRILQIHKRSPLELEVAANIAILAPLAYGIHWLLQRVEHVIKIRQEAERLKQMKLNTKAIELLLKEADEKRKQIADEAAEAVKEHFKSDHETRNAVKQALSKVLTFIEDGGQLDIDVGKEQKTKGDGEGDESQSDIRGLIENIRKEMKTLPPPASDNDGNWSDKG